MKKVLLITIATLALFSCKKASTPTKITIQDTVNVTVTYTDSIITSNTNPDKGDLSITTITNPSINGLFAVAYIHFDIYDSTQFKSTITEQTVALPGTQLIALSNTLIKPNVQNIIIDSVHYDQTSVPTHYLTFAY